MNTRQHRRVFFYVVPVAAPLVFLAVLEGVFRILGVGTPSLATDPARGFLPFNKLVGRTRNRWGRLGIGRQNATRGTPVYESAAIQSTVRCHAKTS